MSEPTPHAGDISVMDQTAFLHLDNKLSAAQAEFQQRVDGLETRTTVQISSVRSEVSGFMGEIRAELKRLNEGQSGDRGARTLIAWFLPLGIAALQLMHDFRK